VRPELIGLAWAMSVTLGLIATFHAAWSLGLPWPRGDRRSLARTTIGRDTLPGPLSCFAVAAALLVLAVIPLAGIGVVVSPAPQAWTQAAGLVAAAVFGLRGVIGYTPAFDRSFPGEPFRTLNRLAYSPLCLTLAAGFLALRYCYPA
jgi:hypothetical protein